MSLDKETSEFIATNLLKDFKTEMLDGTFTEEIYNDLVKDIAATIRNASKGIFG